MDLTLLIYYADEPSGTGPEAIRKGDIVAVDRMHAEPCGSPKCVQLHVTGAPERGQGPATHMRRIQNLLMRNVVAGVAQATEVRRDRYCQFQISEMNPPRRNELRDTKNLTVSWNYFKNRCAKKIAVVPADPLLDDLTARVEDVDI